MEFIHGVIFTNTRAIQREGEIKSRQLYSPYTQPLTYNRLLNPATPFVYTTLKSDSSFSFPSVLWNSLNFWLPPCAPSAALSLYLHVYRQYLQRKVGLEQL